MENLIKCGKYTFKTIKSTNPQRPYRVQCLETGAQNDSALSYDDAVSLIMGPINYAQSSLEMHSKDFDYVKKLFTERLIGKKKKACDEMVQEIVDRQIIKGDIVKVPEVEKYERTVEYLTECKRQF